MLDMLCDQVEAEDFKQERQQVIKQMNQVMDKRLSTIKKAKDSVKTKVDTQSGLVEQRSGLLIKSGSRKITDDNLTAQTNRREYLPLEKLDSSESASLFT